MKTLSCLLARALRKKASTYIRFAPLPPDDPVLCGHDNCKRSHDDHSALGSCPHPDGSGFRLGQHFIRARPPQQVCECDLSIIDAQIIELEALADEVGEFAADLEEIGHDPT